jgi:hypothetical protein
MNSLRELEPFGIPANYIWRAPAALQPAHRRSSAPHWVVPRELHIRCQLSNDTRNSESHSRLSVMPTIKLGSLVLVLNQLQARSRCFTVCHGSTGLKFTFMRHTSPLFQTSFWLTSSWSNLLLHVHFELLGFWIAFVANCCEFDCLSQKRNPSSTDWDFTIAGCKTVSSAQLFNALL